MKSEKFYWGLMVGGLSLIGCAMSAIVGSSPLCAIFGAFAGIGLATSGVVAIIEHHDSKKQKKLINQHSAIEKQMDKKTESNLKAESKTTKQTLNLSNSKSEQNVNDQNLHM